LISPGAVPVNIASNVGTVGLGVARRFSWDTSGATGISIVGASGTTKFVFTVGLLGAGGRSRDGLVCWNSALVSNAFGGVMLDIDELLGAGEMGINVGSGILAVGGVYDPVNAGTEVSKLGGFGAVGVVNCAGALELLS